MLNSHIFYTKYKLYKFWITTITCLTSEHIGRIRTKLFTKNSKSYLAIIFVSSFKKVNGLYGTTRIFEEALSPRWWRPKTRKHGHRIYECLVGLPGSFLFQSLINGNIKTTWLLSSPTKLFTPFAVHYQKIYYH